MSTKYSKKDSAPIKMADGGIYSIGTSARFGQPSSGYDPEITSSIANRAPTPSTFPEVASVPSPAAVAEKLETSAESIKGSSEGDPIGDPVPSEKRVDNKPVVKKLPRVTVTGRKAPQLGDAGQSAASGFASAMAFGQDVAGRKAAAAKAAAPDNSDMMSSAMKNTKDTPTKHASAAEQDKPLYRGIAAVKDWWKNASFKTPAEHRSEQRYEDANSLNRVNGGLIGRGTQPVSTSALKNPMGNTLGGGANKYSKR